MKSRQFQFGFALALLAITIAGSVRGQERELSDADAKFWGSAATGPFAASAQLVGAGDPLTIAVMRAKGLNNFTWRELGFASDTAPELDKDLLKDVRDGKFFNLVSDIPQTEVPRETRAIFSLFNQALINGFEVPAAAFKKSGDENDWITYRHLISKNGANNFRGKVVRVQGRMANLTKFEATQYAMKHGVSWMYEGWIFGPTPGANPFRVIFPILPEGIKPAEKMDRRVTFYGYFLADIKYDAGGGRLETPLLIGPTVILNDEAVAPVEVAQTPFAFDVLLCVLGGLVLMTIAVFVLNAWFRAEDKSLRDTIKGIQAKNRPAPFADEQQGIITPEELSRSVPQAFPVPGSGRDGLPRNPDRPDPERN